MSGSAERLAACPIDKGCSEDPSTCRVENCPVLVRTRLMNAGHSTYEGPANPKEFLNPTEGLELTPPVLKPHY